MSGKTDKAPTNSGARAGANKRTPERRVASHVAEEIFGRKGNKNRTDGPVSVEAYAAVQQSLGNQAALNDAALARPSLSLQRQPAKPNPASEKRLLSADELRAMTDEQLQAEVSRLEGTVASNASASPVVRDNLYQLRVEATRRQLHGIKDVDAAKTGGKGQPKAKAGKDKLDPYRQIAMELETYSLKQINQYPALLTRFLQQAEPGAAEKVRVLGQLAAAVARTQFLLGTIFYKGGDWEESSNRGHFVDKYLKSISTKDGENHWCASFATHVYVLITGKEGLRARSGYKIGEPPGDKSTHLRFDNEGGAFAGTRKSSKSESAEGASYNPWVKLREELAAVKTGNPPGGTKESVVQNFLDKTIRLRPQAGDIMVLRRGSAKQNSFTADDKSTKDKKEGFKSHTTMVEKFSGYTIYTIEGNHAPRVMGRTFDLTNEKDVAEIIFLARPGLNSYRKAAAAQPKAEKAAENKQAPPVGGGVQESDLMQPISFINRTLERLAAEFGFIHTPAKDEPDTVSTLSANSAAPAGRSHQSRPRAAVQRSSDTAVHVDQTLANQIQRAHGRGQVLQADMQAQMSHAMGADFAHVRIHTDGEADALSAQLNARAFTTGRDIFFRHGAYDPHSRTGQELLAHELTHVVQQGTGQVPGSSDGRMTVNPPGDRFEQEADAVARTVVSQPAAAPVQRQPQEEAEGTAMAHIDEARDEDLLT